MLFPPKTLREKSKSVPYLWAYRHPSPTISIFILSDSFTGCNNIDSVPVFVTHQALCYVRGFTLATPCTQKMVSDDLLTALVHHSGLTCSQNPFLTATFKIPLPLLLCNPLPYFFFISKAERKYCLLAV